MCVFVCEREKERMCVSTRGYVWRRKRERKKESVCEWEYVCMCVCERERESMCVCVRERERVCVCLRVSEVERVREYVCVCVWERERENVSEYERVCVREKEREKQRECVWVRVCVYVGVREREDLYVNEYARVYVLTSMSTSLDVEQDSISMYFLLSWVRINFSVLLNLAWLNFKRGGVSSWCNGIVVNEFELQSRYYVHFRAKVWNPLRSQLWVK